MIGKHIEQIDVFFAVKFTRFLAAEGYHSDEVVFVNQRYDQGRIQPLEYIRTGLFFIGEIGVFFDIVKGDLLFLRGDFFDERLFYGQPGHHRSALA